MTDRLRQWLRVAALMGSLAWLAAAPAQAGWHAGRGGSSASSPQGSAGGRDGAGCGAEAGGGPLRGRRGKQASGQGSFGGSSGGSSGGGSSGGSSGGGSSGGSSGGSVGGSHGSAKGTGVASASAGGMSVAAAAPADGALLVVEVPEKAKVFINGKETTTTGTVRSFISRGLTTDKKHTYVVRMVVETDGKPTEKTKTVALAVGQQETVTFMAEAKPPLEEIKPAATPTSLTLRVPANAQVWLQGRLTTSTGTVREFETETLREGDSWNDYDIKVVSEIHGQPWTITRRVTLTAGHDLDLTIDPTLQTASSTPSP